MKQHRITAHDNNAAKPEEQEKTMQHLQS